jgi:cobalt-precorrin 5A hydrolase/precorrin-3B C17-methyltransferase
LIGLVAVTHAGRVTAQRLADMWPDAHSYEGQAGAALPRAFAECDQIVCFFAVGAAFRLIAPLLRGKGTDPGVVCVDEAGRYAVPLLGAHSGGGNALAARLADVLGAEAVITTGSDAAGTLGLGGLGADLGMTLEPGSDLAGVSAAILSGQRVTLTADQQWPLPALRPNVVPEVSGTPANRASANGAPASGPADRPAIIVTDRVAVRPREGTVVYRPPSLVVGVGTSQGAPADEIGRVIEQTLADCGVTPLSVLMVGTADAESDEPGLLAAAAKHSWPVTAFPADELAAVPNQGEPVPQEGVRQEVGTPSVAEAAALLAAGPGATLIARRRTGAHVTVAVARREPRGRLALIGIGPGARDLMTPRAADELRRAAVVIGADPYLERVADLLLPGTEVLSSGLGAEAEREGTGAAVAQARRGRAVALIGSGDAGVYAMASSALELADAAIDVVVVPGVSAALAVASVLGAPLGHDHVMISLCDQHTPWEITERRIAAAADSDLVTCFYNPASAEHDWQLPRACELLAEHRPSDTPVGWVRDATRPDQVAGLSTLGKFDPAVADMHALVVVGSSRTRVVAGRMVTPRGYRWTT